MMSKFKAVFTDMDGTLLGPDHKVSDFTRDVLQKLRAKNIPLILATGRPYAAACHSIKDSGLEPDYFVCTNGGRIRDRDRKIIGQHNMDPELVADLAKLQFQPHEDGTLDENCGPKKFSANLYADENWLTDNRVAVKFVEDTLFENCMTPCEVDFQTSPSSIFNSVHQIFFLAQPSDISSLKAYIERKYDDKVLVMLSHPCVIDVVARNIDKSVAVNELCLLMGYSLDEVVAFGDSMNDLTMLKAVPNSYVMSNALPILREALPGKEVIGSNAEDGVARKLMELFDL